MKIWRLLGVMLVSTGLLVVAGCGDDNDDELRPAPTATAPPTNTPVPPTATVPPTDTPVPTATATPFEGTPPPTATQPPTPTPGGEALCGNGAVEADEECDDGNNTGGDGCAPNCTEEIDVTFTLDPAQSMAFAQFGVFGVPISLAGEQTFVAGKPRSGQVLDAAGEVIFEDGEAPITLPAANINLEPVEVPGLACVCVGGVEVADRFGPGNAGAGKVGCGPAGLPEVDYELVRDHNIDIDSDPAACEAAGGTTEPEDSLHPGVCNGPNEITFTGGGPAGSAVVETRTSLGILLGVDCGQDPPGGPKGDDGLPCTADDEVEPDAADQILTTGQVTGTLVDANNVPGAIIGPGQLCGGLECQVTVQGAPFDCDRVLSTGNASGGAIAGAFTLLDGDTTGDGVNTVLFVAQ